MDKFWGPFTQAPNLLILMTDQQRTTQHYPVGWVENNLPNLWHLMQTGVSFPNAMTNASPCSPSRAVLWTGTYPWINGVTGNSSSASTSLSQKIGKAPLGGATQILGTFGQMLAERAPDGVVYDIAYKGKWHLEWTYERALSPEQQQETQNEARETGDDADMSATFGFPGWTSPDFGTAVSLGNGGNYTLGAGIGGNDQRVVSGSSYAAGITVENACEFLTKRYANGANENPFCLIVSLLNPHDIWVSPNHYLQAGYATEGVTRPWQQAPFTEITDLPQTYRLLPGQSSQRPQVQAKWRKGYSESDALDYLRFYAYLETLSDALLGQVLAALPPDQMENTMIVRLADHGEMGMSQGGMTEKEDQAYNETILVPMIFSHPGLPQGEVCPGLAGLVDIVPTLAEICGLTNVADDYVIQGCSLATAILAGNDGTTCSQHLFCNPLTPLYALIENKKYNCKYVVTASGGAWHYELYDFSYDPTKPDPWPFEAKNRIPVNGMSDTTSAISTDAIRAVWHDMHVALTEAMKKNKIDLSSITPKWPSPPS